MKFRKICAFFLALACLQSTAAFATTVDSQEKNPNELQVEYMEFYNNQQYYKDLAKNKGLTIIIDVGEEYADLESARIANEAAQNNQLVPVVQPRTGDIPTSEWNILQQGKKDFRGTATNTICYTSFKYWGCTSYEVSVYNSNPYKSLSYKYYGTGDTSTYTLDSGKAVIRYIPLNPSTRFYLGFYAPAEFSGYVAPDF